MKKSTPWAEQHAEAERQIRADEREKVLAEFSKSQRECYEFASKIMQRTAALKPPVDDGMKIPGERAPESVPKRKAVTTSQGQIDAALEVLLNVRPPDEPLTPKQIAGTWNRDMAV